LAVIAALPAVAHAQVTTRDTVIVPQPRDTTSRPPVRIRLGADTLPVRLPTILSRADRESYRRAVSVNVDGVVFGVRRLAQVMGGGSIVVTASLAGLVGMPLDAIYSLTKHAVVGFVRSVAPQLAPIRINAICPGIADTPMLDQHDQRARFVEARFPLLQPTDVADAMWLAATSEGTGECWFVQPGRPPAPFRFANVPGPRRAGDTVGLPPI
jgi:NAD(P)-dependent dehydrogenase (short-subunit alcohol dehydrogenase family)